MQPLLGRVRLHAFSVALSCSEVFSVPPLLLHPHIKTAIIVLLQTRAPCALLPLAAVSNHQYIHNLARHQIQLSLAVRRPHCAVTPALPLDPACVCLNFPWCCLLILCSAKELA